jgi:uncharacterized protein YjaG (DUF416 family)
MHGQPHIRFKKYQLAHATNMLWNDLNGYKIESSLRNTSGHNARIDTGLYWLYLTVKQATIEFKGNLELLQERLHNLVTYRSYVQDGTNATEIWLST